MLKTGFQINPAQAMSPLEILSTSAVWDLVSSSGKCTSFALGSFLVLWNWPFSDPWRTGQNFAHHRPGLYLDCRDNPSHALLPKTNEIIIEPLSGSIWRPSRCFDSCWFRPRQHEQSWRSKWASGRLSAFLCPLSHRMRAFFSDPKHLRNARSFLVFQLDYLTLPLTIGFSIESVLLAICKSQKLKTPINFKNRMYK
jgi:hypothetical protein